jgi:hypothetical protein
VRGKKGSKVFFSVEKKQKTFANSGVCAACTVRDSTEKSLLVLFYRKEHLTSWNIHTQHGGVATSALRNLGGGATFKTLSGLGAAPQRRETR